MNLADIAQTRLHSQQIAGTEFSTAKEMVGWMGAIQAQDYAMSQWAVGLRLPNATISDVETALDNGEIIRTHVMRPTWHLVSADDIYWMLELTAPQIKTSLKSRHRGLGLSESVIAKSLTLIENTLAGGEHRTRQELVSILEKAGIRNKDNRAAHLLLLAELDGIICSGESKGGKPTYALLAERVRKTKTISREEALGRLAHTYFFSHGPATLQDFTWWSGLSVADAKNALEFVRTSLVSETIGSDTYWFGNSLTAPGNGGFAVYLLPAYDEFIISYKDRSAVLTPENQPKAISQNGMFWPVVVSGGKAAGLWKRAIKKNKVIIEIEAFQSYNQPAKNRLEAMAERFGCFLGKETEITYS